jgi:hypothetical protein
MIRVYFTFIVLFFGCKKQETSLFKLIKQETNKNINNIDIFVASDSDCMSCYYEYLKMSTDSVELIGLFDSKYPKEMKERLKKVTPSIEWNEVSKKELIKIMIKEANKDHGPYYIKIRNGHVNTIL